MHCRAGSSSCLPPCSAGHPACSRMMRASSGYGRRHARVHSIGVGRIGGGIRGYNGTSTLERMGCGEFGGGGRTKEVITHTTREAVRSCMSSAEWQTTFITHFLLACFVSSLPPPRFPILPGKPRGWRRRPLCLRGRSYSSPSAPAQRCPRAAATTTAMQQSSSRRRSGDHHRLRASCGWLEPLLPTMSCDPLPLTSDPHSSPREARQPDARPGQGCSRRC